MLSRSKAALIGLAALCAPAQAHDAPKGWAYDTQCCSSQDCREINASQIREGSEGYTVTFTGETLAYDDRRIRYAPDGLYHWCECPYCKQAPTRCLYVPRKGM